VEAQLRSKTAEADDLEQQVIRLEETQETLEDECANSVKQIATLKDEVAQLNTRATQQDEHINNLLSKIKSMRSTPTKSPPPATSAKAVAAGSSANSSVAAVAADDSSAGATKLGAETS